jgi:hypothetical protein
MARGRRSLEVRCQHASSGKRAAAASASAARAPRRCAARLGRDDHVPDSRKIECKAVHVGHVLLLEDRDGPASEVIPQQLEKGFERAGTLDFDTRAHWPRRHETRGEPLGVWGIAIYGALDFFELTTTVVLVFPGPVMVAQALAADYPIPASCSTVRRPGAEAADYAHYAHCVMMWSNSVMTDV